MQNRTLPECSQHPLGSSAKAWPATWGHGAFARGFTLCFVKTPRRWRAAAMASMAIGLALGGITCLALVALAMCFPALADVNKAAAGPGGVPPPMIFVSESAGLAGFVIAWSVHLTWMGHVWGSIMYVRRHLLAAGLVLMLWAGFLLVAPQLVRTSRGLLDGELLVCGLFALLGSFSVIAVASMERRSRNRPSYSADGKLDLRCPQCDYRMVGLTEARCPECGTRYTIDELLAAQHYMDRLIVANSGT